MATTVTTRISLRRDNDYNYAAHPDFKPFHGEVCLVDTATEGLKVKIGDGIKKFTELDWYYPTHQGGSQLILGYYYNGDFYKDAQHQQLIERDINNIYIDKNTSKMYYYDGTEYKTSSTDVEHATDTIDGIMKLYSVQGQNTDGTMTQKAITDGLEGLKLSANALTETLIANY